MKKYSLNELSNKKEQKIHSMFTRGKKSKKNQIKLCHNKHSKLRALSKLVHTFTLRYSLASKAFPKTKYSVVCSELPMGLKFHFSQWKIHFC